ncbi:branched-chain/neutral amino acids amide ABC transporter periplasmic substrate-binding protein 1 [Halorubrum californiense DSM 19288]|uniref:Branched-chain/neutral amino acids amide ABC transporter periplasmic substrate-binding protein 1 n=1 Tax=Halorubrum californiense DSM 19288 TaxID=1227465 RepID=M0EDJ0_9EURY|nr:MULTISPECIES: ABC transporter substrate-binding protein [Halorubrum]ELZ45861.1 branched-chain/neutral amino acids amide ABC transporter periplasmic substrate-binding protein 1 [Halorubrum californiense DSM 19288]TKX69632.1 branched-chain amino acid ABC transporter substrate-binding protein [Halorubrum sp. GN11GM_10-3_MGM]
MKRRIQRRDVLKGAGAVGIAGIAGCSTESGDGGDGGDGSDGGDGMDGGDGGDGSDGGDDMDGGDGSNVPDAVMVVGFPQSGIQLFRDFYSDFADSAPDLDIIVPDGLIDGDLPGEVDNDMNNVIGTAPSAGGPGAEFFTESYQEEYGEEPGVFTAQAYDAMAVEILAATAAGENNGEAIRDRVRTVANPGGDEFGPADLPEAVETVAAGDPVHYVGASSSVNFDVNGDIATAAYDIIDFQDGELVTLDTVEFGNDLSEEDLNATAADPVGVDSFTARIGVLMPETGDLGPLGVPIRDGALLAATQVNDAGINVDVETRVEDTQTDPQAGISGANALVNAGFGAVVGPASSNVNLQVSEQVFIPNGVVGISPSSTDPNVTDLEDNGYIFRTAPSDLLQGPAMADLAVGDTVGAESSGTLYLNDAYGQSLEEAYVNAFEERDGTIDQRVSFEPNQATYTSQWSSVLNE